MESQGSGEQVRPGGGGVRRGGEEIIICIMAHYATVSITSAAMSTVKCQVIVIGTLGLSITIDNSLLPNYLNAL
jgi:hypothetical protein